MSDQSPANSIIPEQSAEAGAAPSRLDKALPWVLVAVFGISGIALWATNGAAVFASAISGLWALCF